MKLKPHPVTYNGQPIGADEFAFIRRGHADTQFRIAQGENERRSRRGPGVLQAFRCSPSLREGAL